MDRPRVLFVDNERPVLSALRRLLHRHHPDWEVRFHVDTEAALACLPDFDPWLIVSEWRMPGVDVPRFLEAVTERAPTCVRVLLTADKSLESFGSGMHSAHFVVGKPFEIGTMSDLVSRTRLLRSFPMSEVLRGRLGALRALLVLPQPYQRLNRELMRKEPDLAVVAQLIRQDQALLTRLLRVANSSFFGFCSSTISAQVAVTRLGVQTLRNLVLTAQLYRARHPYQQQLMNRLMDESMALAELMRQLGEQAGLGRGQFSICLDCALLHNLGKLVNLSQWPETATPVPLVALDAGFEAVGAYLLALWGFDPQMVAALYHQSDEMLPAGLGVPAGMLNQARQRLMGPASAAPLPLSMNPKG